MDYHNDPVDPVPNETCNGLAAADVLAQEYLSAPPHMLDSDPENRHRLRPQLRAIVQKQKAIENTHQSVAYVLSEAVELLFWQTDPSKAVKASDEVRQLLLQPNFANDFALAVADLAVTGATAFKKFAIVKLQDAVLEAVVTAKITTSDPNADISSLSFLVKRVLDRAYGVAWALRAHQNRQLYLRPVNNIFGWIAVSGEDDAPHRPVNVPTAPFPAFDVDVKVGDVIVRTRYVIASKSTQITSPIKGPFEGIRDLPPEGKPIIPPGEEVILYLHGHSSRLEECLDLAPQLWKPSGSKSCKSYCVIAMDLPSCGYSDMLDWQQIVKSEDSDQALQFIEDFVLALVDGLTKVVTCIDVKGSPVELSQLIATVIGGSLGGNLCLRLGERTQPFWVSTVAPWSPASVWDPYPNSFELDFPDLLKPFKYIAVKTAGDNAKSSETDSSRKEYFKGVFDRPTSPNEFLNWVTAVFPALGALLAQLAGIYPPLAILGIVFVEIALQVVQSTTQPKLWYRDDWQPCKDIHISGAEKEREEIYNTLFRKWHWRLGCEQLRFSHRAPSDDPRYRHVRSKTLVCAGEKDDHKWTNIYSATRDTAARMWNTPGSTLFLKSTGHSIHNERPLVLAAAIHSILPPLPDSWSLWDNSLGGPLASTPRVAVNEDGRLEVFGLRQDGRVWHIWQTGVGSWAGAIWAELSPGLQKEVAFSGPAVCNSWTRNRQNQIEIFEVDTTGRVCHIWQNAKNNGWHDWNRDLSGNPKDGPEHQATSPVACLRKQQNGLQVIA